MADSYSHVALYESLQCSARGLFGRGALRSLHIA